MSRKQKQYSPEFRSKVALAAIRGDKTIAEIGAQYDLSRRSVFGTYSTPCQGEQMNFPWFMGVSAITDEIGIYD